MNTWMQIIAPETNYFICSLRMFQQRHSPLFFLISLSFDPDSVSCSEVFCVRMSLPLRIQRILRMGNPSIRQKMLTSSPTLTRKRSGSSVTEIGTKKVKTIIIIGNNKIINKKFKTNQSKNFWLLDLKHKCFIIDSLKY